MGGKQTWGVSWFGHPNWRQLRRKQLNHERDARYGWSTRLLIICLANWRGKENLCGGLHFWFSLSRHSFPARIY